MMRLVILAALVAALMAECRPAGAADCSPSDNPVAKQHCAHPELAAKDVMLNRMYGELRAEATPAVRRELMLQERAWLTRRDRDCGSGNAACLSAHYDDRLTELRALAASATATNSRLQDASPVYLKGTWKAVSVMDPFRRAEAAPDKAALSHALASEDLPDIGAVLQAQAGLLCQPGEPCEAFGWRTERLDRTDGDAYAAALHVTADSTVAIGSTGSVRSSVTLVPRGRDLLARFALCAPDPKDCRGAYEVWSPASPDATMVGLPKPG